MLNFKAVINNSTKDCENGVPVVNGEKFEFEGYTVEQKVNKCIYSEAYEISTALTNTGSENILLNRLSSYFTQSVAPDFQNKDILIHTCRFTWQGEGQWRSETPYEFGIYPVAGHGFSHISRSVDSNGSWSTSRWYPIVIIEDKTDSITWGFELEASSGWQIELGTATDERGQLCITVDCNAANELHNGFTVNLSPKESFAAAKALFCSVDGGFNEAVNALLCIKRENGKCLGNIPICFNDYMNCLWAMPTRERLIPLIDAASSVGAEVFCIDDGWFYRNSEHGSFGDWLENDSLFGENGFSDIINYISSKNMKPGIWFELESAFPDSNIVKISPNALMTRNGKPVKTDKLLLNFCDKSVTDYLYGRIKYFYDLGVRYIKNDYNQSAGIGCDTENGTSALGLIRHSEAFLAFIDRITEDFPDLTVENCGSGAMRCDNGTLKHFHIQSISDQERFFNNPSVLRGVSACIPPEKCGVWSYPYPLCFEKRNSDPRELADEFTADMSDGIQTAFNMALGFFGVMNLSGHIELCDELNLSLIKSAIKLMKEDRAFLSGAYPVFLGEQQRLFEKGISVLALRNGNRLRIGIFKNGGEKTAYIPAEGILRKYGSLTEIYPKLKDNLSVTAENGMLKITSENRLSVGVFETEVC